MIADPLKQRYRKCKWNDLNENAVDQPLKIDKRLIRNFEKFQRSKRKF